MSLGNGGRSILAVVVLLSIAEISAACRRAETPRGDDLVEAGPSPSTTVPAASTPTIAPSASQAIDAGTLTPSDAGARARASDEPGMLLVPGGTFTMGTDQGGQGDERPAHAVAVDSFFLDRTEVTQSAYSECVSAGACKPADPAAIRKFGGVFQGPNRPVVGVSWFDAKAYCAFRGKRLPREAEFERAVRGTDSRRFPWGNELPTPARAIYSTNHTEDVGSRPEGKGPFGHDDLAGNVWEWMEDEYDPYAYQRPGAERGTPGSCDEILAAQNELRKLGKKGFTGTNPIPVECEKSIRGGAYNYDPDGLRSTNRVHHPGRFRLVMTGLRCAKDAAAPARLGGP